MHEAFKVGFLEALTKHAQVTGSPSPIPQMDLGLGGLTAPMPAGLGVGGTASPEKPQVPSTQASSSPAPSTQASPQAPSTQASPKAPSTQAPSLPQSIFQTQQGLSKAPSQADRLQLAATLKNLKQQFMAQGGTDIAYNHALNSGSAQKAAFVHGYQEALAKRAWESNAVLPAQQPQNVENPGVRWAQSAGSDDQAKQLQSYYQFSPSRPVGRDYPAAEAVPEWQPQQGERGYDASQSGPTSMPADMFQQPPSAPQPQQYNVPRVPETVPPSPPSRYEQDVARRGYDSQRGYNQGQWTGGGEQGDYIRGYQGPLNPQVAYNYSHMGGDYLAQAEAQARQKVSRGTRESGAARNAAGISYASMDATRALPEVQPGSYQSAPRQPQEYVAPTPTGRHMIGSANARNQALINAGLMQPMPGYEAAGQPRAQAPRVRY